LKVLVTGATGFIGRRLMKRLLADLPAGDITCLIKPATKPREGEALASYRAAGVRLIEGDLCSPFVSGEHAPKVDIVFHLAANIDTAASGAELDINDVGTEHLLAWMRDGCRGVRIVYTSSIAVHDRRGPSRGRPISESSPLSSRTEYGITKLRGERILQSEGARRGYTYSILRLATVYGPDAKPGGLFDLFAQFAAGGNLAGRLNWPGRTSVIYVDDVTALMVALAQTPAAADEVYCVANPVAPTVGELARHIGHVTGHPVRPLDLPRWVWGLLRAVACNRLLYAVTPRRMKLALWRLSLIVDDGFWFDTRKLQTVWTRRPTDLSEGLTEMLKTR
jgi:nucleoside-diphosphate-sugar epimerase